MSFIASATTAFPENIVNQSEIKNVLINLWPKQKEFIEQFSDSTTVEKRHLTLPLHYYRDLQDIGKRNTIWKAEALRLQQVNIQKILDLTKIDIADIGLIASASSTGMIVPSLEALLMNTFPFSPNTKRLPLFGLGCLAGVAGINRVHDYLLAHPAKAALLLVSEFCSLTFQLEDESIANIIGTSLFGDGTAAVLLVGTDHPLAKKSGLEILATESVFFKDTERVMGWDVVDTGFQIVLSNDIPKIVKEHVGKNIDEFLAKNKLKRDDICFYIAHPGGPKVLEALAQTLNHTNDKFALSWECLAKRGNISSVSVLHILEKTLDIQEIDQSKLGLMMAMGPAFCLELTLVRKC